MIRWILDLLYPPKCILCGRILADRETDLCHSCRSNAPEWEDSRPGKENGKKVSEFLDSFTAVWYYEQNARRCLHRFKFYGRRYLAEGMGRLLAMRVLRSREELPDVVTWAPVSAKRKRQRGYDQSELLAKAVASELGLPAEQLLQKIADTPRQSGLDAAARKANVIGVYQAVSPEKIRGRQILLVDDIVTTGETMKECARVLSAAGAEKIHGASAAAVRRENSPNRS